MSKFNAKSYQSMLENIDIALDRYDPSFLFNYHGEHQEVLNTVLLFKMVKGLREIKKQITSVDDNAHNIDWKVDSIANKIGAYEDDDEEDYDC